MWSGTTFTNFSGNIFGVHQKVDRIAFRVLHDATNVKNFPSRKLLLHFEGRNGPDGIKAKSPAQNEPWHYIDPFDPEDTDLIFMIEDHYKNLVKELKNGNKERAAFEASWLAHAMVDGLTPAHHFPYEDALIEMRKGESIETRTSLKEKLVMKGDTVPEKVKNNWLMWGFKGVMVSHGAFEFGVAAISGPLLFRQVEITPRLFERVKNIGFTEYYLQTLREIALWNMYEEFTRYGWTWSLSKQTRDELMPRIIEAVAMGWYLAMHEAGLTSRLKK
jgi:hypothetical protein